MDHTSEINVSLPQALADTIEQAVASGDFASDGDVIRAALREWVSHRSLDPFDNIQLPQLWSEGMTSGPGRLGDIAAIKTEAKHRLDSQLKS